MRVIKHLRKKRPRQSSIRAPHAPPATRLKKRCGLIAGVLFLQRSIRMKFQIADKAAKHDGAIYLLFDGEKPPAECGKVAAEEFAAKAGEITVLRREGVAILCGMGKKDEFELETVRVCAGAITNAAKHTAAASFSVKLPALPSITEADAIRAFVEGALLSDYEFDKYKTKKDDEDAAKKEPAIHFVAAKEPAADAIRLGTILAESTNYTRNINNEPPNVANAEFIAAKAEELAAECGLKCKVYSIAELAKMGLHGIAAVSSGSKTPGRLVVLEYGTVGEPVVFVGKGITFDSGGISIKPSRDMDKMRWDKSGACAVLGIMRAASKLKVKGKVVGVMPLAENMPAGFGYRPGDIFKTGGKAIEIINTDAEGRIILSDALAFVRENYKQAKAVVDMATLTGACVVALGSYAAGLMTTDAKLGSSIESASRKSGEKVWQLPLWREYEASIKSKQADIKNSSENGEAGTITAALFLKNFVGKWPWAHLDIAGTAYQTGSTKAYMGWGCTGAGVRICAQYLLDEAGTEKK